MQRGRDLGDVEQRHVLLPALYRPYVGAMESGEFPKLLLGVSTGLTDASHIASEDRSRVHAGNIGHVCEPIDSQ